MELETYPALKKHICLRISKGRFLVKNLRTEDCLLEDKDTIMVLALCNGENQTGNIIESAMEVFELSREEAEKKIAGVFKHHQNHLLFQEKPHKMPHVDLFYKQCAYRTNDWKFSPLREESPFTISITLTEHCNHRCNYCFKSCTVEKEDELIVEQWKKVIDDAADSGIQEVTLSGGEPTLYKGFLELVSYITEKGMYSRISTNGTAMTEEFVQKLRKAGADYIHLSLPAFGEDTFGKITECKENLEKVKKGIRLLHEAGFYIRVKTVLVPENLAHLDELERLIDFCVEQKVEQVHLAPFIYTADSRGGEQLIASEQELLKLQKMAQEKQKQAEKTMICEPFIDGMRWNSCRQIVSCGGIKEGLTVISNGNVTLCEAVGSLEEFKLGNLKEDRIMDIWQSEKPDTITQIREERLDEECRDCDYLDVCQTGCFLFSYNTDKNPWSMDPRCWKNRNRNNVFRKYPVLKNTARIKKLPDCCWLTEVENDVDDFISPLQACILALCRGDLDVNTISYIVQNAFKMEADRVDKLLDETLEKYDKCLFWEASLLKRQNRYQPEDFIFQPEKGILAEWERCETPCEMHLSLTKGCNFKCIYCFNASTKKREDEMSTEKWLDIIGQAKKLGVVKCTVTGGEPMTHDGVFTILEELKKNDILTYLCTNGSLITDEVIEKLKELDLEIIQLSLDTVEEETHDRLTQTKGQLPKVKNAIRRLTQAGIKVFIKSVLTPVNVRQVPELIDTCMELGVKKLVLDRFDISSFGRGDVNLVLSNEEIAWVKETVTAKRKDFEGIMQVKDAAHPTQWCDENDIVPCGAFRKSFIVLPNGDVTACEKLIGVDEMTAGNLMEQSVKDIWYADRTSKIINPEKNALDDKCQNCSSLEKCGGGCYAIKHFFHKGLYGMDPRCFKNSKGENPYLKVEE